MVAPIHIWLFVVVAFIASCANPTSDTFGRPRVTEQEIQEITPVIHKRTYHTSETITGFYRQGNGTIDVWTTSDTIYIVRRVDHTWKIVGTSAVER